MTSLLVLVSSLLIAGAPAAAAHAGCPHAAAAPNHASSPSSSPPASSYAGLEAREIKALGEEEIAKLRAGEGLGFAMAAELNGYPGPKHVLELAGELGLRDEQREGVTAAFTRMQEAAMRLGAELIAAERQLDALFAGGTVDETSLAAAARASAALRGELRAVHLRAHLETVTLLDPEQRRGYQRLRGYATADHSAAGAHVH